jgi:hypothetical protein
MYVKRTIEVHSFNQYYRGKAISIRPACSEWVSVALVIQHAKLMRRIISAHVACLVVPYFSILCHKRHDFRKEGGEIEHKICALTYSTTSA